MAKYIFHLCIIFCFGLGFAKAQAEEVDLELVLAMDGSGSISPGEYILQLEGTAAAFRDPAIQAAITSGPTGRIAVAVLVWSDAAFEKFNTGWYVLDSPQSANSFANVIRNFYQHSGRTFGIGGGGTGIGDGVREALDMLNNNGHTGLRRVIDVSGDGVETDPWFEKAVQMPEAKLLAQSLGVTINGLPILNVDFPRLDQYYRKNVISGRGSFIVVARDFPDFGRAIREKLKREINIPVAHYQEEEKLNEIAGLSTH